VADAHKILIIDDERDYAEILKERLVFKGYEVIVAYDGTTGLALVKEWEPDLVLLDIMMPEMDGFETARQLRSEHPFGAAKIIFVTAFGREPDEAQRKIIGSSPVVRKPFEMSELLSIIARELPQAT
jgi:DNA-binding response OmpR family regulator